MQLNAHEIVFFFGAGASAPFGIPTMKQFVVDFEKELNQQGSPDERNMYTRIKKSLEDRLQNSIDLEGVFTVIDGIINCCPERLGLLSMYLSSGFQTPSVSDIDICKSLKQKFHSFIRKKCLLSQTSFNKISEVYRDFFNRFWYESDRPHSGIHLSKGRYNWCKTWTMFTTNYDTCLEHYWRQVAKVDLNTGTKARTETRTWILDPELFSQEDLRLFKLHGSISWFLEEDGNITEEQTLGQQLLGRQLVEEMMVYPIQQKELYLEPYISMLKQLNYQLKTKPNWVIIGYSFNDPVIQEIFIRNSNEEKRIALVHPHAQEVSEMRLKNIKCKKLNLLNQKFGESHFRDVHYNIIMSFKGNPRRRPEEVL